MKKSTLFFTVFGFLCIIIGGFTALMTFNDAKDEVLTQDEQSFPVSGDTLTLDISSKIYYQLSQGDSDKVVVQSQYINLDNRKLVTSGEKITGGNLVTISDGKNTEKYDIAEDILDDTLVNGENLFIEIPTSVKHLILNSSSGRVYDLSLDDLKVATKNNNSQLELSDLVLQELIAEDKQINFHMFSSVINTLTSTASNTSMYIQDTKINETNITATNLDFSYYQVNSPKTTITANKGSVSLGEYFTGDVDLTGDGLSLNLSLPLKGNINATLERGDISGSFDSYPKETYIKGDVATGDVDIFGNTSYGSKNSPYTWDLATTLGNISLSNYNDWEEDNLEDSEVVESIEETEDVTSEENTATSSTQEITE